MDELGLHAAVLEYAKGFEARSGIQKAVEVSTEFQVRTLVLVYSLCDLHEAQRFCFLLPMKSYLRLCTFGRTGWAAGRTREARKDFSIAR
jgi:hypothetical protein